VQAMTPDQRNPPPPQSWFCCQCAKQTVGSGVCANIGVGRRSTRRCEHRFCWKCRNLTLT
jgi:hypothetical protein